MIGRRRGAEACILLHAIAVVPRSPAWSTAARTRTSAPRTSAPKTGRRCTPRPLEATPASSGGSALCRRARPASARKRECFAECCQTRSIFICNSAACQAAFPEQKSGCTRRRGAVRPAWRWRGRDGARRWLSATQIKFQTLTDAHSLPALPHRLRRPPSERRWLPPFTPRPGAWSTRYTVGGCSHSVMRCSNWR